MDISSLKVEEEWLEWSSGWLVAQCLGEEENHCLGWSFGFGWGWMPLLVRVLLPLLISKILLEFWTGDGLIYNRIFMVAILVIQFVCMQQVFSHTGVVNLSSLIKYILSRFRDLMIIISVQISLILWSFLLISLGLLNIKVSVLKPSVLSVFTGSVVLSVFFGPYSCNVRHFKTLFIWSSNISVLSFLISIG